MKRAVLTVGLLLWPLLAGAAPGGRFTAVDVFLDSAAPVAAWQFEIGARDGAMRVVGVENGDSESFHDAPYYDREAVQDGTVERLIVADYSLAGAADLPAGRFRLSTLHLLVDAADEPVLRIELVKAVAPDGNPVAATIHLRTVTGEQR